MVLQAQSGVLAESTDVGPTPSPLVPAPPMSADELASQLAVSKGQVRDLHPVTCKLYCCIENALRPLCYCYQLKMKIWYLFMQRLFGSDEFSHRLRLTDIKLKSSSLISIQAIFLEFSFPKFDQDLNP